MKKITGLLTLITTGVLLSGCSFLFQNETQENKILAPKVEKDSMMMKEEESMDEENTSENHQAGEMMEKEDSAMEKEVDTMDNDKEVLYSGAILAGSTTRLFDFNKADYNKALANEENIVLYFYADWCPLCKNEVANSLYPAFSELSDPSVIGFRVNFRDGDTDKDEEQLAKDFGVAYQHTKVFLKNGSRVLKDPSTWNKKMYLEEIKNLAL